MISAESVFLRELIKPVADLVYVQFLFSWSSEA
jgi:hypothetical protein